MVLIQMAVRVKETWAGRPTKGRVRAHDETRREKIYGCRSLSGRNFEHDSDTTPPAAEYPMHSSPARVAKTLFSLRRAGCVGYVCMSGLCVCVYVCVGVWGGAYIVLRGLDLLNGVRFLVVHRPLEILELDECKLLPGVCY